MWELQVKVIAAYGPMKGKEVWQTLSKGPGYREDAITWLNANPWTSTLGNLNLVIHSEELL
jgi:hypothetical protein